MSLIRKFRPHFLQGDLAHRAPEQLWPNIANEENTLIDKSTFAQIFILTHQRDSLMPLKMGSLRREREREEMLVILSSKGEMLLMGLARVKPESAINRISNIRQAEWVC